MNNTHKPCRETWLQFR